MNLFLAVLATSISASALLLLLTELGTNRWSPIARVWHSQCRCTNIRNAVYVQPDLSSAPAKKGFAQDCMHSFSISPKQHLLMLGYVHPTHTATRPGDYTLSADLCREAKP